MIAPMPVIGFLFETVFTLTDRSIVYLLTQGGPANATKILPVLAYQVGIQAGALGRGAAISPFLFPLLPPLIILLLRNPQPREDQPLAAPPTPRPNDNPRSLLVLRGI